MATLYICDKCGCFITEGGVNIGVRKGEDAVGLKVDGIVTSRLDICGKCKVASTIKLIKELLNE